MADNAPSGLLEACLVVGASEERLQELCQLQGKELPMVEPEVLQVHAPPFVTRQTPVDAFDPAPAFSRVQKRRSFKKRDRPAPTAKPERSPDDLSVPQNIDLIAMQQLCFPDGLKLTRESREDLYHFLVFTDVFGNQTHGVVARFSRPVQRHNGLRAAKLFTTLAICIISKYPYYNALRDCLSCFLAQLKTTRSSDFEEQVKEFSAKLALVPIPPPGSLHVVFQLRPLLIQLSSRLDADRRVLDLDLHLPFLCFKPKQILQIIGGILMEQRLVFLSTDWSRLTLVAESFMSFIHPLRWQHPFVPVLSRQMLDFLMAPTAYMMGCHTFQFDEVTEEIEDLVLINIDHGTVTSSSLDALQLPVVPAAAGDGFRLRCRALPLHFDLELCHAGTHIDINDLRGHRRCWQHRLNSLIMSHSLELLLNIFSEVCDFLNYEHRVFNSEEFLRSRDAADLAFYTKVLDTHIFHSFLRDRLSRRSDAFTRLQQKLHSETRRLRTMTESPRRPTMEEMNRKFTRPESALTRRLGRSMPDLADHKLFASPGKTTTPPPSPWNPLRPITTFKLPEFPPPLAYHYVQNYYHELLAQLGRAISAATPDDSALLARYHYLRGLVNWVAGRPADALADFQSLYKTDMDIFPAALVSTLLEALPAESRRASEGRGELKRLISLVKREKERVKPDTVTVKRFQLPSKHLPPDQFVRCVQESGMVKDTATIRRLFQALTVGLQDSSQSVFYLDADGQQKQVDPDVFRFFYSFWKETEAAAQDLDLPPVVLEQLETDECVYKLSSSVKTSHGVGKIAMTQRRLFLLTEGRPGYMEITKFRHIQEVKLCSAPFLLLRIPSLKIRTSYRREWFEANLKSECDLWHLMIKEMWAGRKMADIHKDPQFLEQALTNALLMDAVVGSVPTQKATYAATKLAYFDQMKSEGPVMTPSTTSETLMHKINPCLDLTAPQAVDVLLYTPGRLGGVEPGGSGTPKLWCGMSDGKVLVFDAASWSLQHCSVQLGAARMNCMLSVNEQQLWIGSQDSCIYIIHPHSVSCNKQLTEHHTEVTGLTLEQRDKYSQAVAYSCSAEGCVIMWDVSSLQVKRQFSISCERLRSVQLHRGMLWFGAGDRVMEVRRNGSLHRDTGLADHVTSSPPSISCFLVLDEPEQVWAGLADVGELWVWQRRDLNRLVLRIQLKDCNGVTCMIKVKNQVWVGGGGGGARGKVYVVSGSGVVEKELSAHRDCVQTLCSAEDRYVLSGAASGDGKIAIWKVE